MAFTSVKADKLPTLKIDSDNSFVLNTNDWNNTELTLSIVDPAGVSIYEDTILPTERGLKKYNLQLLPEGDYSVVVNDLYKTVEYQVTISDDKVASITTGNATFLPQVNATREKIDINLLALSKNVNFSLTDGQGNEVYGENIKDTSAITRRLNIAKLERGDYILRVYVGDSYYTQIIRK